MLRDSLTGDNATPTLDDTEVRIAGLHEDRSFQQEMDDRIRNAAAITEAELEVLAAAEEKRVASELAGDDSARAFVVFSRCGGFVAALSCVVRGTTVGAALFTR